MTQTALVPDYSYLSAVADCARRFYYRYERRLAPREGSPSLHAGSAGHAALHAWYTTGRDDDAALAALRAAWGDFRVPPAHPRSWLTLGHMEVVMRNYFDDRRDDGIEPLHGLVESVEVFDWDGTLYGIKPDLPARMNGQPVLVDHKFTGEWLSDWWAAQFEFSHQMRGYVYGLRAKTGLDFDRVYVNGIYMGKGAADPREKWAKRKSPRSKLYGPFVFMSSHFEETREWIEHQMERIAYHREHLAKGEMAWPQNATAAACRTCSFRDLCRASPASREGLVQMLYRVEEPTGRLASGADNDDSNDLGEAA